MSLLNIFLDDGGVITDKQRRAAEFERLVGDCFVPLLGGTEAAWTRAHRAVVDRLADPLSMSVLTAADFAGFYRGGMPRPGVPRAWLDPPPYPGSPARRSRSHPSLAPPGVRAAHRLRVVLAGTGRVS